jgi:Tol biopolymer transport system component
MKKSLSVFLRLLILYSLVAASAAAQIKIISSEQLPLESSRAWTRPQFSPNGQAVYFTSSDFDGIWEYSLTTKSARQITSDPKSGSAFSVSRDGKQITYRKTTTINRRRKHDIMVQNLADGKPSVVASGTDLSTPIFDESRVIYTSGSKTYNLLRKPSSLAVAVLGTENTKIVLNKGGRKVLLDPLTDGHYVWPSLSPDGRRIVAYEMDRGTFVCDVDGSNLVKLGKRAAPSWTRSGKWIVYMEDRDDGHQLLSSEIVAVSPDGKKTVRLTATTDLMEMNPRCSPTEDKIVYDSPDGKVYLLNYSEEGM